MKKTRNLVLLIALALVLVAGAVGGGYAYWAGSVSEPEDVTENATIEIGEGQEITSVIELTKTVAGGNLVPIDRAVEATDVEEVVLTFDVLWTDTDKASHGAVGELTIETSFGDKPGANLLNVVVNGDGAITAGTSKTITLTITLTEPADLAEYELVANQTFTLAITFSVE